MSNARANESASVGPSPGGRAGSVAVVAPVARTGSRDRALDVLRGWAIVLMLLSHVGSRTVIAAVAHVPIWVSAAEPFVALAGVVLGMRASGGSPPGLGRRTVRLWQIHCSMMLFVVFIHEATGRLRVPWVRDAGGWFAVAWKIAALRLQSLDYMNILPLFIVFFAVAPLLLSAMNRGKTGWVALASFALWAVTQKYPAWCRFTDPICGDEVFVLPAWQLWFVLGLGVGYHGRALGGYYTRHRSWLLPLWSAAIGVLFVVAQLQRSHLERLGGRLPPSAEWLFSKETCGPVRVVYDVGLMVLGYLGLTRFLKSLPKAEALLEPLETLGRRSLYCFLVHLPLALLGSAMFFDTWRRGAQELGAAGVILIVYEMAKHGVLKRYIPS